ncbi:MAG: type II toxin-antitoxin system VapC family toxin [Acidobacteria bacterium]|nr:type II toxin-antitoxin system VapC family toxin [Acidobacteriota bacterium]
MLTATKRETVPGVNAIRYVESSALTAAVLEDDAAARAAIQTPGQRATSALTIAETNRAVLRARLAGRITAAEYQAVLLTLQKFARRCHIVSVTEAILRRAGRPFPLEPIRTLDAIHLATAEALSDSPELVIIVTRDLRIRENAVALGHPVE